MLRAGLQCLGSGVGGAFRNPTLPAHCGFCFSRIPEAKIIQTVSSELQKCHRMTGVLTTE